MRELVEPTPVTRPAPEQPGMAKLDHYRGGRYSEESVRLFKAAEIEWAPVAKEAIPVDKIVPTRGVADTGSSAANVPLNWGNNGADGLLRNYTSKA